MGARVTDADGTKARHPGVVTGQELLGLTRGRAAGPPAWEGLTLGTKPPTAEPSPESGWRLQDVMIKTSWSLNFCPLVTSLIKVKKWIKNSVFPKVYVPMVT